MRQLTLTEWQQLNDAASRGDRLTYWTVLQGAGDRYAFLAGQVVTDVALAGRVANRHFVSIVSEARGTPVTANEVHEFGVRLIRADLDARALAAGFNTVTELLDPTGGTALRANAPELSALDVRDAHILAARQINVTTHGWTLEATFAAFENNPVVLDRVWNRFLDLSLTSPLQAGGLMNGLLEGLILKASDYYSPAQLQSHLANRFGSEVAEFVAQADISGRTADGTPLVSALQDTYQAISRGSLAAALGTDPVYVPPGMSPIEAMLETAEMRGRARALNPATLPRCFAAGTPILMADGTTKPIENIREGDLVMAFAEDAAAGHGDLASRKVTRLFRNVTKEWLEISPAADQAPRAAKQGLTKAYVTPGHRVMTASGQFMRADAAMAANVALVMADGSAIDFKARRIAYEADTAALFEQAEQFSYAHDGNTALAPAIEQGWRTYNFEVEERHTYIAAGLRVHNDSLGAAMQLGGSIGSFIADQMLVATGHDNIALRFGVGAVAGRIGQWVGATLHDAILQTDSSGSPHLANLFSPANMAGALVTQAANMAGAALARGLLRTLNLDGNPVLNSVGSILGGTLAQAAAWEITRLVADPATQFALANANAFGASNVLVQPGTILPEGAVTHTVNGQVFQVVGPNLGNMIGSSAASFVGTWAGSELARALVKGDPKAMSIGSSIGGMVGSAVGTLIAGQLGLAPAVFALATNPVGWVIIGIAAFVGAFAGGALAGTFSKKKVPHGHAIIDDRLISADERVLKIVDNRGTGGGESPARNLAQSAIQVAEALLRMAGVENINDINPVSFTVHGGQRVFRWADGTQWHSTGGGKKVDRSDPSAMVEYGAIKLLHASNVHPSNPGAIQSEGDFLLTRVLRNTDATSLKGVEADFRLAFAYAAYQDNKALFDGTNAGELLLAVVKEFYEATGRVAPVKVEDARAAWEQMKVRAEEGGTINGVRVSGLDLDGAFTRDGYMRGRTPEAISDRGNVDVGSITPATTAPDPENFGLNTTQTAWSKPIIVIDLNGDGVGAFQANETGVLFDFDGDTFREETAWISPWDAFLVWDLPGNDGKRDGNIGSVAEMILGGAAIANDGFWQLAELDTTGDGYFDANDSNFFDVRLWTDRNFNGSVDFGELWSLTKFGIERISLQGWQLDTEGQRTQINSQGQRVAIPDSPLMVWGDAANPLWSGKYSSRQPDETLQIGGLVSLQLSYGQLGVKPEIVPNPNPAEANSPDWIMLVHEGGTRTAIGASADLHALGTITNLRTLIGGEGNDLLSPGLPDQANPTAGVRLGGGMGNDTLVGTDGGDVISGDGGVDSIFAGNGDDVVIADASDNLAHIRGGNGFDVLVLEGTLGRTVDLAGTGFEAALGSDGAESMLSTGADFVILGGGGGNDTLRGTNNADRLEGDEGADYLIAGAGDDLLVGGAGADTLDAGAGNDIITTDAADLTSGLVRGGAGTDVLLIDGTEGASAVASVLEVEEIEGSDGDDWLDVGSDSVSRRIAGAGGDDTLVAGFGNDTLEGGEGRDVLSLRRATSGISLDLASTARMAIGSQTISLKDFEGAIGSGFADTIIGQNSLTRNWIEGGNGGDSLDGGAEDDVISYAGSAGAVTVNLVASSAVGGDATGDVIRNFEGAMGSAQADSLLGSSAHNWLSGGAGADTLDGGAGNDTLSYAYASGGVTVNLATGRGEAGESAGDIFSGFEVIQGSDHADVFRAAGRSFSYVGGLGADMVSYAALAASGITVDLAYGNKLESLGIAGVAAGDVYAGIEIIEGTAGADSLRGGDARETLIGGDGADTLDAARGGGRLEGGAGDDVYHFRRGSGLVEIADTAGLDRLVLDAAIKPIDLLVQTQGNDLIIGLRPFGVDWLRGGAIVDQVRIIGGADSAGRIERLVIGEGASAIEAFVQVAPDGEGTRLIGGTGTNLMVGGTGSDTLESTEGEGWLYGGAGSDFLSSGIWDDILDGGDGNDTLDGGNGNDTLLGGDGDDLLNGGNGNDLIIGDDGNDTLIGGEGDDTLLGGAGNDLLIGDGGDDFLDGGRGNDTMDGGAGHDTYRTVERALGGTDSINDSGGNFTLEFLVNSRFTDVNHTNNYVRFFENWRNFIGMTPITSYSATAFGTEFTFGILPEGNRTRPPNDSISQAPLVLGFMPGSGRDSSVTWASPQGIGSERASDSIGKNSIWTWVTDSRAAMPTALGAGQYTDSVRVEFMHDQLVFERKEVSFWNRRDESGSGESNWSQHYWDPVGTSWIPYFRGINGAMVEVPKTINFDWATWYDGGYNTYDYSRIIGWGDVYEGSGGGPIYAMNPWHAGFTGLIQLDPWNIRHTPVGLGMFGGGWGYGRPYYTGAVNLDQLIRVLPFRGDDTISGTGADDTINGGPDGSMEDGHDSILGLGGNDSLSGAAGRDTVNGGSGDDQLRGGMGNDYLFGDDGRDTIYGQQDDDTAHGGSGADLIFGGDGQDSLIGGSGADTIYGEEGLNNIGTSNDSMRGGAGNDRLYGGNGNDVLDGDLEDDLLLGGNGNDSISGGSGNDFLDGHQDADLLNGGDGRDTLEGHDGDDSLLGGAGNDRLLGENGDDQLNGGADDDSLYGQAGRDTLIGSNGRDRLEGGDHADHLSGGGEADQLFGQSGDDSLVGGDGDDRMLGGIGNDRLEGGEHNDLLYGEDGDDRIYGGGGNDLALGGAGSDLLTGDVGNDTLAGEAGNDTLYGGADHDSLSGGDEIFANDTQALPDFTNNDAIDAWLNDTVGYGAAVGDWLDGFSGNDTLAGGSGDDTLIGGEGHDRLLGGNDEDLLIFGFGDATLLGNDTVDGGAGYDVGIAILRPNATLNLGNMVRLGHFRDIEMLTVQGNDTTAANGGHRVILGAWSPETNGASDSVSAQILDVLSTGIGNDTIRADVTGLGAKFIRAGDGDDLLDLGAVAGLRLESGDTVFERNGKYYFVSADAMFRSDAIAWARAKGGELAVADDAAEGQFIASIRGANNFWIGPIAGDQEGAEVQLRALAEVSASRAWGVLADLDSGRAQWGVGGVSFVAGFEHVIGSAFGDILAGDETANRLSGGNGDDRIAGRVGNDTLLGGNGDDELDGGNGADSLMGDAGHDLLRGGNGADSLSGGDGRDALYGGADNDSLFGDLGDDYLDGGDGADTMAGGNGDDVFIVGDGDVVSEISGQGIDTILLRRASFNLDGVWVENVTGDLAGQAFSIMGNMLANVVIGGSLADTIVAGADNDTLDGGAGDDQLYGGTGRDRLIGGAGNDWMDGEADADTLDGGVGDDQLTGGAGNDCLIGGFGLDLADYAAQATAVTVSLVSNRATGSAGLDTLSGIENLRGGSGHDSLLGDSLANQFHGGNGNDTLNGGAGDDWLDGGLGNDSLIGGLGVDVADYGTQATAVTVSLLSNRAAGSAGSDTLSGIENVVGGTDADSLLGDGQANALSGGAGNDTLSGGDGADTLDGGPGDDSLLGGNGTDVVSYAGAAGAITVSLSAGTSSGAAGSDSLSGIENVLGGVGGDSLLGDDLANGLFGGAGNDRLNGGNGNDILDGGDGADTMAGGNGDDVFIVGEGDVVVEGSNQGFDTVLLRRASFSLPFIHVEAVIGDADLAFEMIGNSLSNALTGGALGDTLEGYQSADTLFGLAGNDLLDGGTGDDFVAGWTDNDLLRGDDGNDSLYGQDGRDTIYGGTGNDLADGWTGDDFIDGEAGADTLYGSTGNDTLIGGEGDDYLAAWQDNDVLSGGSGADTLDGQSGNDSVAGGDGADLMYGNDGNDTLAGGSGTDTLYGGTGDDLYIVDDIGDRALESGGQGYDVVLLRAATFGLGGTFIEAVIGDADIAFQILGNTQENSLTGGSLADTLLGYQANDTLVGLHGDDWLDGGTGDDHLTGGAGNDSLVGGLGSDNYYLNRGDGADRLNNAATDHLTATDRLVLAADVARDQVWLRRSGDDLLVNIIGTSDSSRVLGWYTAGTTSRLDSFVAGDGRVMTEARVEALVQAMATMTPPPAGQTNLTTEQQNLLNTSIAAAWQ